MSRKVKLEDPTKIKVKNKMTNEIMTFTIFQSEAKDVMNTLKPEISGVWTHWYNGIYVIGTNKKKYGAKRVIAKLLERHQCPAHSIHNFNTNQATRWLRRLGFKTYSDETVPNRRGVVKSSSDKRRRQAREPLVAPPSGLRGYAQE